VADVREQCLDEQAVLAFVVGDLAPEARERSEAHLDHCSDCLVLVAEIVRQSLSGHPRGGAAPRPAIESAARYEIGEEIARGGMGTVHLAHDRALDRKVAVKLMRLESKGAGLARRFAREVMLTARLQHPSIVPIYDAAVLEDGTPFYAMRFVAGQTLDRAIASAGTMAERLALVPAVLAVAEAVAYAHSEGVVHRDLKPQNVLVGKFGETVVLDWGLAKDLHGHDDDRADQSEPIAGEADIASALTATGDVVGTIAYMPPERLHGGASDERGDVYGLGCILYQVLVADVPRRTLTEEPSAPSQRQAGVPVELEAIVVRAMQPTPELRYASAAELADDLRRFLTGKLVAVHAYTLRELLMRWLKRHRGAVAVAALSLVGIAAILVLAFQRVVAQREVAQAERGLGERERLAAEDLVSFMLGELNHRLAAVGRLDALVGTAQAIEDYFAHAPVRSGVFAERAQRRHEQALELLGDAAAAHGDLDQARHYYDQVLELSRAAATVPSEDADGALCAALMRRAGFAMSTGENKASTLAGECLAIAEARAKTASNRGPWQFRVANAMGEQGQIAHAQGDDKTARALLEQASTQLDELEASHPTLSGDQAIGPMRAMVLNNLVIVAVETNDLGFARTIATRNLAAIDASVAAHPGDSNLMAQRVGARTNLALVERHRGDLDAAVAQFEAARSEATALCGLDTSNVGRKRSLGAVLSGLAELELARNHLDAALVVEQQARDISRELANLQPASRETQTDLASDELSVADIQHAEHHDDDAALTLRQGLVAAEALAKAHPGDPAAEHVLATLLVHQADVELDRHHPDIAMPALLRVLDLRRKALSVTDTPHARLELVQAILIELDMPAAARTADECTILTEARDLIAPVAPLAASDTEIADALTELALARRDHPRCHVAAP